MLCWHVTGTAPKRARTAEGVAPAAPRELVLVEFASPVVAAKVCTNMLQICCKYAVGFHPLRVVNLQVIWTSWLAIVLHVHGLHTVLFVC